MTAFITPQPDHQPRHIGQSTILLNRIKTKQFMFCGFISQGRAPDFELVGSSAIWVSLTSLLLRMETEQTANTNTNQSLNSRVNKKKSLVGENMLLHAPQSIQARAVWAVEGPSSSSCLLLLPSPFFTICPSSPSRPTT